MTVIAAVLAVSLVATVFLMLRYIASAESAWADERRELLNRIQRPEQIIPVAPQQWAWPDEEPDEIEKVGTIADPPPEMMAEMFSDAVA